MKNIYLLSNPAKTSVSQHLDSISSSYRRRVLPILFIFLTLCCSSVWGEEDDTHDFSQSISQLLNNKNAISSIDIADQGYPIKSIEITCRYNKNIDPAVTIEVLVGGASYAATQNVGNNFNSTKTFNGDASGAVQINFTNLTGDGTGHGTFYVTNVRLVEGAAGGGCTDPSTLLSITNANTATIGTPLSLTTDGGNGSTVTWSIVSGDSYATLTGSTLTPTAVGTVRIQASQGESGGECGATVTKDITISNAPINVTLNRNGATEVINNVSVGTALDDIDGTGAQGGCDAWTFVGWSKSQRAAQNNSSPMDLVTTVDNAGPYYAVYKNGDGASVSFNPAIDKTTSTSLEKGGITISTTNGSFNEGTDYRIYKGATFTVDAGSNNISSISLSYSSSSYDGGGWPTSATPNTTSWSQTATSGSSGEQARITSLSVTTGTVYYSTTASCAPTVQATASPWVTSAQGATVKVEVPVTATNFDASCTLSASVSGSGFSIVGWGANGNSVTAGEDLTTSLILEYNPTVYSSDATITFNSTYGGSQTPVYTAGTVHGRSLSGLFVIAIKNGGTWYALPADMSGSGTYAGVAVDVDDIDNPTKVTAGPATALYRLMGVHPGRYGDYGTRVRFMSEYNSKCLWSNQANGGTGINNGAIPLSANSDNYEWTLVTTDGVTYAINTNVAKKIEEGRELRYFAGESKFGMYASGNSSFRLLPVDCWTRATVTNVSSTYNTVTLTWAGKSGTEYNVYIEEGGVTKKTENNVSSPVTISGLDSETNYTWIISPGEKDNGCALSGAFTTNVAPINVTLSCDGTEYALGAQDKPYTLPTTGAYVANACTEWEFAGWTDGTYSKSTSAPTFITEMNASGTAYAVYRKTDGAGGSEKYVRVTETEQITDGQYLIMCNTWGDADDDPSDDYDYFTALKGSLDASFDAANTNYITNVKRNTVEDTIGVTSATTANEVTITAVSGGHTIKTKSNYYIGRTASGNGINSSKSEAYVNTLSISSNNFVCEGSGGSIYLKFNTSWTGFRYYASGQADIQLYKRTSGNTYYYSTSSECCNEVAPPTVSVEAVDVSATISWNNQVGATNGYNVTCTNGTNQDVAAGVTSLEITGLSPLEDYEYTVTAKGATCNRSYTGTFTTASCAVVPTGVSVTPSTSSVIVRWVHAAAKATVTIYSDNTCSDVVKTEDNLTTGCTVSGLEEGRTYFLKVFAGAGCGSSAVEFTTLSSAVMIAEWFPDSIRINLTADTATATVLIEDKQTTSSSPTSYADGLFFSKYYEAYLSVKLWAVYNGTNEKVSLANIKVKSANNGNYWAKDNATGTGAENSAKITSLASFGHHEIGYIYPGEEIIVYNPGPSSGSNDYKIIECMESTYGLAYKNDPDSVWYMVQNQTTALSGDDGLILLDGTDTLDVIGGKNPNEAWLNKAQPSWGDANGWNCSDGEDVDGNTLGLSTNRCLLVRKNTVKSGLNAVSLNTDNFYTLCDEWWGSHVPVGGDEIQTSCDNFSYVGHYDYNKYYAKFDSVTTVDELGGKQNDDGTYTIPIPQLDTLSCTMLRINVYEGTELKTSAEYKVPIMVEGNKTTQDTIFVSDYPTQTRTAETCKECDVVILKGATLTKDEHTGNDVDLIRNLTIYPGGTMDIPASRTFNVSSVQFRVEGENVPFIKLAGTLQTSDQQVLVSRRINNSEAYFFSLPYDCNISDIRWSNGEPAVLDEGFRIKEYDSRARADQGSTKGAPGHWKMVTGSTLEAGKGYQISVNSKYLKELIFPLDLGKTNVSDAENEKAPHGDNIVPIHQYENGATTINNHNWNFIAQPYLCAMSPMAGADITYGYLEYEIEDEEVKWYRRLEGNQYLTIYNPSTKTYDQIFWNSVSQLDPFVAFFVQGKREGSFTFTEGNRKNNAPARHLASQAEVDEDPSIFVGVTLSGNGLADQANLRVRQDFTEDEYKLGYDLLKFTTYYKDRPQVYMKTPSYQLAFQAVSDSVAKNTWLPMGVYCYKPGTYTFGLSNDYPIDEVEAVYLYDKVAGVTTNLLYDTYTITTSSQLYTNTRFALNVIVNRRAPQVTTDIGIPEAPDNMVRKILINGHVYIQRGDAIYDITGKQMLNF